MKPVIEQAWIELIKISTFVLVRVRFGLNKGRDLAFSEVLWYPQKIDSDFHRDQNQWELKPLIPDATHV